MLRDGCASAPMPTRCPPLPHTTTPSRQLGHIACGSPIVGRIAAHTAHTIDPASPNWGIARLIGALLPHASADDAGLRVIEPAMWFRGFRLPSLPIDEAMPTKGRGACRMASRHGGPPIPMTIDGTKKAGSSGGG